MLYFFTKEIDVFAYAFFIAKHGGKNIVKRIIADTDRRKKLIKRFVMFFVDNFIITLISVCVFSEQ